MRFRLVGEDANKSERVMNAQDMLSLNNTLHNTASAVEECDASAALSINSKNVQE